MYRAFRPYRELVGDFFFVVREFPDLLRQFREESAHVRRLITNHLDGERPDDDLDSPE